jgi:hypothetical protein
MCRCCILLLQGAPSPPPGRRWGDGPRGMSCVPGVASLKAEFGGHAATLARDIITHRPWRLSSTVVMYRPPGRRRRMAGKYERLTRSSRTCRRLRPSTTAGASIATNTMPATTPKRGGPTCRRNRPRTGNRWRRRWRGSGSRRSTIGRFSFECDYKGRQAGPTPRTPQPCGTHSPVI